VDSNTSRSSFRDDRVVTHLAGLNAYHIHPSPVQLLRQSQDITFGNNCIAQIKHKWCTHVLSARCSHEFTPLGQACLISRYRVTTDSTPCTACVTGYHVGPEYQVSARR